MLKVTNIVPTNELAKIMSGEVQVNAQSRFLVVLHLTDCTNDLLAATFAANDYVLTAHLDKMCGGVLPKNPQTGAIDLAAALEQVKQKFVGNSINEAYGFSVAIGELLPNVAFIEVSGTDLQIAQRRIVGIGSNEQTAKTDAISREKARLDFGIAKERYIPHYVATTENADE